MGTQNLWYYREQLFRIIEESLEVSLIICNAELSEFTVAKVFDIFNQVVPTGFVLNTGYWPFYNTIKKQSICICGRYGLDCRHFRHDYHWIDLDGLPADNTMKLSNKSGNLNLLNSEVDVTPVTGGGVGYSLAINLTLEYKKAERGRPRRKREESSDRNPDSQVNIMICSRYLLQREYYPALHTIMFQPSPFSYETYGTYFPKLLQTKEYQTLASQNFYTVTMENIPHYTLVLQYVNLPIHYYSKMTIPAIFAHVDSTKLKKPATCKSTQTVRDTTDVWRYKELIANLKPLWTDSRTSSCESLYINSSVNSDIYFSTHIVNDLNIDGQLTNTDMQLNAITDSIKNEIVTFDEANSSFKKEVGESNDHEPTSTTIQDNEYDAQWPQWGYQKAIAKRRGRKKYHNIQVFGDTVSDSKRRTNQLGIERNKQQKFNNSRFVSIPSYATVLKSPKSTQVTNVIKESYSDDPDFKWFDSQFPDLVKTEIKRERLDEEFDIAEEFIKQEKEREDNRWLHKNSSCN